MNREENGKMGRVKVTVRLANHKDQILAEAGTLKPDQARRARVPGVADTGASYLVLPKSVAEQLGVPVIGQATVRYADHRKAKRKVVDEVQLELLGRRATFQAIVEPRRKDVLIGGIVLETLDLLVDCRRQKLRRRDPKEIITEIE